LRIQQQWRAAAVGLHHHGTRMQTGVLLLLLLPLLLLLLSGCHQDHQPECQCVHRW
jgi:hypothetical protein